MVLYQLLSGMNDSSVQAGLLAKSCLTLAKAEKYATDREMAKSSQTTMTTEELGSISSKYHRQKQQTLRHHVHIVVVRSTKTALGNVQRSAIHLPAVVGGTF